MVDEAADANAPGADTDTPAATEAPAATDTPAAPETLTTWTASYLSPAAAPVLAALGAFIYTFSASRPLPAIKTTLSSLQRIVGTSFDGVCLAVATGPLPSSSSADDLEDLCIAAGFEYISFAASGKNEYGEAVGVDRVREALEANDWDGEGAGSDDEGSDGEDGSELGLKAEEMVGLMADEEDEEKEVERVEAAMAKLVMLKEMGDDVSKEERRRIAQAAIRELMKP